MTCSRVNFSFTFVYTINNFPIVFPHLGSHIGWEVRCIMLVTFDNVSEGYRMARQLVPSQQKLAEKLSLINDRGIGMLTRIYNIKKVIFISVLN